MLQHHVRGAGKNRTSTRVTNYVVADMLQQRGEKGGRRKYCNTEKRRKRMSRRKKLVSFKHSTLRVIEMHLNRYVKCRY